MKARALTESQGLNVLPLPRFLHIPLQRQRLRAVSLSLRLLVICAFFSPLSLIPCPVLAESTTSSAAQQEVQPQKQTFEVLWQEAADLQKKEEFEKAATLFEKAYQLFPDHQRAEEALWQTAKLRKQLAVISKEADWDGVKNLFRKYIDFFPNSPRLAEAYIEVGNAFLGMRFYREALTYFKLVRKKYPESNQALEAKRLQGEVLAKLGNNDEAEILYREYYEELKKSEDKNIRISGMISMGDLRYAQGNFQEAKDFYQMVILQEPDYYMTNPDILRKAGLANIQYGKIAKGRDQLFHFLNLVSDSYLRTEVLFGLGESYFMEEDFVSAQKFYHKVIEEGHPRERPVLLSQMRIAQHLDDPDRKMSKWERPNDLKDAEGDAPYQMVLQELGREPIAQEARYGLYLRYKAREDLEKTYAMGRDYLRNSQPGGDAAETARLGGIMLYLVEALLEKNKYQDIYDLYFIEFRHVKDYPNGRLLYLVGKAMESLNLFEQAAIVYWRATKWPIDEKDKVDLYYRRARVYLALKDYTSADRLLTHLRKIYAQTPQAGEVDYYSGKLAEALGQKEQAWKYYIAALENPTFEDKITEYLGDSLRLAIALDEHEQALELLNKVKKVKGVRSEVLQDWALKIGNGLREQADYQAAIDAYQAGLTDDLPPESERAQAIHLYLGDCYFSEQEFEQGIVHYKKAEAGASQVWKKMAVERMNQYDIENELVDIQKALGR